jgi:hypothetical protein
MKAREVSLILLGNGDEAEGLFPAVVFNNFKWRIL